MEQVGSEQAKMDQDSPEVAELMRVVTMIYRLQGVLRNHVGKALGPLKLAKLDTLTLGAAAVMPGELTVAQVGRMFSFPRQSVQRSANALVEAGLVELVPNPQHKRAPLLRATEEGTRVQRASEQQARRLSASLAGKFPPERARAIADELYGLLEAICTETGQTSLPLPLQVRPSLVPAEENAWPVGNKLRRL